VNQGVGPESKMLVLEKNNNKTKQKKQNLQALMGFG
jgi:hypothetical protein